MSTARRILAVVAVLLAAGLLLAAAWWSSRPVPDLVQGEVEATQVNVSAKLPARLAALAVREGQRIARGDLVATLDSPEITARLQQAEAARAAAVAVRDKVVAGAREEEIRAAREVWQRALHARELAEKTFVRVERLHRDGVLPAQRRDEAEANLAASRDAEEAAKAAYEMAVNGARSEDKAAAAAAVERASAAIAEVEAWRAETTLAAPVTGEVWRTLVEAGELVGAGYPIVTIVDLTDVWVTFNLREDRLAGLSIGDRLVAHVPALGRDVELAVSFIAPHGDFATWRSTSAQGGFDLKTFEVRARPVAAVEGLRPGMSAIVKWDRSPR
ncbi:MAG TPA: efflux RND transporter periplasmic adaptor subunit [Thermoanaerobaculaceae bacterium]|nr:efflux RND transporter periplasmic adaptor subunit [Thermoanaerobaculaceae bacterium]HRS16827.1 efflux RND transporter periplasmic adaptor subunit [Thermoanaerobaculaceae bacterium]